MKFIIDTHIFLWALADPGKIEPHKRTELETVANKVYVSSIRKPKEPAAALSAILIVCPTADICKQLPKYGLKHQTRVKRTFARRLHT
jgi:hypothetical protein